MQKPVPLINRKKHWNRGGSPWGGGEGWSGSGDNSGVGVGAGFNLGVGSKGSVLGFMV